MKQAFNSPSVTFNMKKKVKLTTSKTAFKKLTKFEQEIVQAKSVKGTYAPEVLLEALGNIKQYMSVVGGFNKARLAKKKKISNDVGEYIPLIFSFSSILMLPYIFIPVARLPLIIIVLAILGLILGKWLYPRLQYFLMRKIFIQDESHLFDFLLPLLLMLTNEVRPGTKLSVELDFVEGKNKKYKERSSKNYRFLTHRMLLWGHWVVLVLLVIYQVLQLVFSNTIPRIIPLGLMMPLIICFPFFYPFTLWFAFSNFGKNPKVKSRFLRTPRLLLKAQLADYTMFQVDITTLVVLKKMHKRRDREKNLKIYKIKKKHQVKTITTLKLGFSKRKYLVDADTFSGIFERKPRLRTGEIAKIKLKSDNKKNVVAYRDVQTGTGDNHQLIQYPLLDFQHFFSLVMEGGYNKLRENILGNTVENLVDPLVVDDLTKIKGIDRTIELKLNNMSIFSFQQLVFTDIDQLIKMFDEIGISQEKTRDWQSQAGFFLPD